MAVQKVNLNGINELDLNLAGTVAAATSAGVTTITQTGVGGTLLETNGTPNGSQSTLNLKNGSNVSITDDGAGGVTIAASSPTIPILIGFVIGSGATGSNIGPMLAAVRAGSVTKCVITTKNSDASVPLTFKINKNGVNVFSANPTVPAGTGSGIVTTTGTLTSTPLSVAANDVFSIDITSGNGNWQFSAQLE